MTFFRLIGTALVAALSFNLSTTHASAHEDTLPSPLGHAPIGVMAEHRHDQGDWMLSYRFMTMGMSGLRDGTTDLSAAQVRADGFPMVPLNMDMDMHMFGGMYGWSDSLTIMAMLPYTEISMTSQMPNGTTRHAASQGFGDFTVQGLQRLTDTVQLSVGLSMPTGSIDESGAVGQLPYPMQLGSGTYDILTGLIWQDYLAPFGDRTRFGVQYSGIIRTGTNDNGYRLGNRHQITAYANHQINPTLSLTGRVIGRSIDHIHGRDRTLTALMMPASDPDNHGGDWVDLAIGFNYVIPGTFLKGHRLAAEYQRSIYQNLNGPQLKMDDMVTIGVQMAFGYQD